MVKNKAKWEKFSKKIGQKLGAEKNIGKKKEKFVKNIKKMLKSGLKRTKSVILSQKTYTNIVNPNESTAKSA